MSRYNSRKYNKYLNGGYFNQINNSNQTVTLKENEFKLLLHAANKAVENGLVSQPVEDVVNNFKLYSENNENNNENNKNNNVDGGYYSTSDMSTFDYLSGGYYNDNVKPTLNRINEKNDNVKPKNSAPKPLLNAPNKGPGPNVKNVQQPQPNSNKRINNVLKNLLLSNSESDVTPSDVKPSDVTTSDVTPSDVTSSDVTPSDVTSLPSSLFDQTSESTTTSTSSLPTTPSLTQDTTLPHNTSNPPVKGGYYRKYKNYYY